MKKAFLIVCATACGFTLITILDRPTSGYPPSIDRMIIGLLFWPILWLACLQIVIALALLLYPKGRRTGLVALLLSAPTIANYSYLSARENEHRKEAEWQNLLGSVAKELLEYRAIHPERFHSIGADEAVLVDGFAAWLQAKGPNSICSQSGVPPIVQDGILVDQWGNPLVFALDRNHDGYIDFLGYHKNVTGIDPPFHDIDSYHDAVAVDSAHDKTKYSMASAQFR